MAAGAKKSWEGGASIRRQLRIMVLDTSQPSHKILEVILRREGHQVACFDDSLAALRFLCRPGPADLLYAQTSHGAPFLSLLATSIILGLPT
jgi:CheY-like chemotaxis protein